MSGIFLCYRREDSADVAGRLYDRLVAAFGYQQVFKDVDNIPPGVDFTQYIQQTLSHMTIMLVIIGQKWLKSVNAAGMPRIADPTDYVALEIYSAFANNLLVIPVLVQNAPMPTQPELPYHLQALALRNAIVARPDPDFHTDTEKLIGFLGAYVPVLPSSAIASNVQRGRARNSGRAYAMVREETVWSVLFHILAIIGLAVVGGGLYFFIKIGDSNAMAIVIVFLPLAAIAELIAQVTRRKIVS